MAELEQRGHQCVTPASESLSLTVTAFAGGTEPSSATLTIDQLA